MGIERKCSKCGKDMAREIGYVRISKDPKVIGWLLKCYECEGLPDATKIMRAINEAMYEEEVMGDGH